MPYEVDCYFLPELFFNRNSVCPRFCPEILSVPDSVPIGQSGEYRKFSAQDSTEVFRSDPFTVSGSFDQVAARVAEINTAIDGAQFTYYARTQNFNSYAFTVFQTLTGQPYITSADFPGSGTWLATQATPVFPKP